MAEAAIVKTRSKPKLAFIGTGWIGLNRMKTLLEKDVCTVVGICDATSENAGKAKDAAVTARVYDSAEELIAGRPDGIVIATPNALHYSQSMAALNNGIAVFCQKPLAPTAYESNQIISAARRSDKLLGVDMSYRYTEGMQKIKERVHNNQLGEIFAADLIFHNAYGPDKQWFYNPKLSGGGCVIDLGIHLVDLALWIMDFPTIRSVNSTLYAGGKKIYDTSETCEDFASVHMETDTGATIRLTCSWNLNAGKDAEIKAAFYGTRSAAVFENIEGSFYNFTAFMCYGTSREILSSPPDDWGGKALIGWVKSLQHASGFDEEIENYEKVASLIDKIYGQIPSA